MLKKADYDTIRRWEPRHYNPHWNVVVKTADGAHELASGFGSGDDVSVFREDNTFYVLSQNTRLPYVGLARHTVDGKTSPYTTIDALLNGETSDTPTPKWAIQNDGEFFAQGDAVDDALGFDPDKDDEPPSLRDFTDAELVKRLAEYLP